MESAYYQGTWWNWLAFALPYMENGPLYNAINFSLPTYNHVQPDDGVSRPSSRRSSARPTIRTSLSRTCTGWIPRTMAPSP